MVADAERALRQAGGARRVLDSANQVDSTTRASRSPLDQATGFRVLAEQLRLAMRSWTENVKSLMDTPTGRYIRSPEFAAFLRRVAEAAARYHPANWRDVDVDTDVVWRLAVEEGLALVWVPRGELVVELVNAADIDARWALLKHHADDIIADCEKVCTAVTLDRLNDHTDKLTEAIGAYRADLTNAAQALAAVVFTSLVQEIYANGKLARLGKSELRAEDPDRIALRKFKGSLLVEAAITATSSVGDMVDEADWPKRFNRNLTLHRVSGAQYNKGNAVAAIMLSAALLAEAQSLVEDGVLEDGS